MANKIPPLKLYRSYYSVSDAAKLLQCDQEDIFFLAGVNNIVFSTRFSGEGTYAKSRVRNVEDFIRHINGLEKDDEGYSYISEFSLIKIHEIKIDKKLIVTKIKGHFKHSRKAQDDFIYFSGQPPEYPSLFVPAGNINSEKIKFIQIDWLNSDGFGFDDNGYISCDDIRNLHSVMNDSMSSDETYKSLSIAQQERHAVKRNEVLSVALYLYKENSNYRKESASALSELIFSRAQEFWPEEKEPPLSHAVICKLISGIFKKPVFTKN